MNSARDRGAVALNGGDTILALIHPQMLSDISDAFGFLTFYERFLSTFHVIYSSNTVSH